MTNISQVSAAMQLLRSTFPDLDEDVSEYIENVLLANYGHFDSARDLHDAVGGLLNGFSVGVGESKIDALCTQLFGLISPSELRNDEVTLDAPVHMANLLDNFSDKVIDNKSIWMAKRETYSVVDPKKLGKAEAKLKEKQAKKSMCAKTDSYSLSSTKREQTSDDFASVNQQIDRKDLAASAVPFGRHSGDIRFENFDISYGSRVLIQGANLVVSYGRRYGLVGRNGFGKTTLLRAIARRDLQLPQSLKVLHVEQEMTGDSTPALESVLRADTERANLLAQLADIRSSANGVEAFDGSVSVTEVDHSADRLTQIYNRLAATEADKAPARAAIILRGLGFDPEMQKRPTKEFSGGWRMRLSLAQALFASPDLLLLDEPTNMLDMRALIWLEGYLRTSTNIIIIVSHDRSFLNSVSTDIIHLTGRRLDLYRGNYDAFEQARAERLLNQQREYEAQKAARDHVQQFIEKFRFNAKRASLVQSRIKYLERLPAIVLPEKEPKIVIRLPDCDKLSGPVVQLDEVGFSYVPGKPVLYNVDLSASSESRICIVEQE
ncbi:unnamed protein product [Dicrocoelium dendriticum]|nr:unnamed protein product [Dicrocoelium dendriticum]